MLTASRQSRQAFENHFSGSKKLSKRRNTIPREKYNIAIATFGIEKYVERNKKKGYYCSITFYEFTSSPKVKNIWLRTASKFTSVSVLT